MAQEGILERRVGVAVRHRPSGLDLALVFILYYAGAKLGVGFTVMPEGLAIVWPPNAVLLAALIRFRGAAYPAIATVAVAAEVAADVPTFTAIEALLFGLVNLTEATLAYWLLARWRFDARFARLADLWKFLAAGPLIGALSAALLGAAVYSGFRGTQTSYAEFARIWWFGDALGLLILAPLLLGFGPFGHKRVEPAFELRRADLAVAAGAVLALALFFASQGGRVLTVRLGAMVLMPFVLYAAVRLPFRFVAFAIAFAAAAVIAAMTGARQPFGPLPVRDAVIAAQEFVLVMALMALGLAALLSELRERYRMNEQLERLSTHDALTGLLNRRGVEAAAQREFALARRNGRELALLLVDLDRFKGVNDRHGHLAGDEALRRTAAVLRNSTRASDSCGRYGGEELVVLAPETDLAGARVLAERIRATLEKEILSSPLGGFGVTASVGISTLGRSDGDFAALLSRADAALYRAKANGRNRVESAPQEP